MKLATYESLGEAEKVAQLRSRLSMETVFAMQVEELWRVFAAQETGDGGVLSAKERVDFGLQLSRGEYVCYYRGVATRGEDYAT